MDITATIIEHLTGIVIDMSGRKRRIVVQVMVSTMGEVEVHRGSVAARGSSWSIGEFVIRYERAPFTSSNFSATNNSGESGESRAEDAVLQCCDLRRVTTATWEEKAIRSSN
jgi:hypothetical protein